MRDHPPLILKRASPNRASGQWRQDDYDVLENGVVLGRIFCLDAVGPQGRPWMWASGHNGDIRRAAHGYDRKREAAMAAAFARRLECSAGPVGRPGAARTACGEDQRGVKASPCRDSGSSVLQQLLP